MEPEIISVPEFTVSGYQTSMMMAEAMSVIPGIWGEISTDGRVGKLLGQLSADANPPGLIGMNISQVPATENPHDFSYLVGVVGENQAEFPDRVTIPEATWAVFDAQGESPVHIQKVIQEIWSDWVPTAAYEVLELPMLEIYLEPPAQLVWLPVRPKTV